MVLIGRPNWSHIIGYSTDNMTAPPSYQVPDVVKDFLRYFRDAVVFKRDIGVIHNVYEQSWNKLTERYYRNTSWPPVESVAPLVDDGTFCFIRFRWVGYSTVEFADYVQEFCCDCVTFAPIPRCQSV